MMPSMGTRVAVAASNSIAVDAGLRLAELGGNAVDAGLAAVLVAMTCEPGVASLGGGAFVTLAPANGSAPVTVDGNVEMPGRGADAARFGSGVREIVTEYGGGTTMGVGHGSVATPGALAAYGLAHARYGRAPWREVVAPVIEAAKQGFPIGRISAEYLEYVHESVYGWQQDSYAALHDDQGRLLRAGDIMHIPHLADSLELIANEGPDSFYRGAIAERIAADMAEHDGLVTAEDLADYTAEERPALLTTLHSSSGEWQLATNPPPAIGGVVLAAMLQLADKLAPDDLLHLIAVQNAVLRYRIDALDLAPDRIEAAATLLDMVATGRLAANRLPTSASTVHVSAVDAEGTACSITSSAGYGSGVMTPGTGIWLNNCLGEQELNRRGLHSLPPGERLASNMAPSVGRGPNGEVLAIGSPGADRITTALQQVITAFVDGGMPLEDAISKPRLHVRHPSGRHATPVIEYERDLELPDIPYTRREHKVHSMYFGGVGAALRTADGGLQAAADPRRSAVVAVSS
jgi:gamma-glutamyltranspeptidase / glutathione hydrolase